MRHDKAVRCSETNDRRTFFLSADLPSSPFSSYIPLMQLSTEECVDIQDRIMAANTAVGAQKTPIKVQGKEYQLKSVGADTLEATAVSIHTEYRTMKRADNVNRTAQPSWHRYLLRFFSSY